MEDFSSMEKDIENCRIRVEKAIEKFYVDWHSNRREFFNDDFSYRIELVNVEGTKYIRLRYGSGDFRQVAYIGKLKPALHALMELRHKLGDRQNIELQKIVEKNDAVDLWFHKYPLNPTFINENNTIFMDFRFVIDTIKKKTQQINPNTCAVMECDIDNLLGFFIDEYPSPNIFCKSLTAEIDLKSELDLINQLDEVLPKIIPMNSKYSFTVEKVLGRYVLGRFLERPYKIYFDINWKHNSYKLSILNIAGFEKENLKKQGGYGLAFNMRMN